MEFLGRQSAKRWAARNEGPHEIHLVRARPCRRFEDGQHCSPLTLACASVLSLEHVPVKMVASRAPGFLRRHRLPDRAGMTLVSPSLGKTHRWSPCFAATLGFLTLVVKSPGAASLLRVPRSSAPRFRERAQGCDDEEANQTRGEVDQHERGEEVDAQEHPEIGIARCSNHVSTLMRRKVRCLARVQGAHRT